MASLKYSKQRESILNYLSATRSHPTADMVYMQVKEEFQISAWARFTAT